MALAPIIVFGYNRPWHLEQTLEALSRNELANLSDLFIFCDGPKPDASAEQLQQIGQTRMIAHKKIWCKSVSVIESDVNRGLATSIITGVTEIVQRFGTVIVLEDDMITSPGFLRYMNDALRTYKDDPKVMHITGYMFPVKHQDRLPETFFYEVPQCWSWATWDRAWQYFSDDIDALYDYWSNDWKRFNHWGDHSLQDQLEANHNRTLRTWFVKWHAMVLKMDGLTLWPHKSLVHNIGFDGSGENCSTYNRQETPDLADFVRVERISPIREHRQAARAIRIFQSGHWYSKRYRVRLLNRIKKILHLFR